MSKRKLSCPIKERAAEMLAAMGVEVQEGMLLMATGRASERLLNLTNQQKIPEGLCGAAAEMAVGEYLGMMKNLGQLDGFDLEAAVKQITEGDTSVTFAVGEGSQTPEQRLDRLIAGLLEGRKDELYRYRRFVW